MSGPFEEPRAEPLPFAARLAVCVFVAIGLEGALELLLAYSARPALPGVSTSPVAPNWPFAVFWATWPLVVAGLLLLRSAWGRVLAVTTLAVHSLHLANELAVQNPDVWVYLGSWGRARLLVTVALDAVGVLCLLSPPARRLFDK